jgi:hypothetical protein
VIILNTSPHGELSADSRVELTVHILPLRNERPNDARADAGANGRYADQRSRIADAHRTVLAIAGLETVGEVREASDEILLSFQDFGKASVTHLRETLGLPSTEGVRPFGKKTS